MSGSRVVVVVLYLLGVGGSVAHAQALAAADWDERRLLPTRRDMAAALLWPWMFGRASVRELRRIVKGYRARRAFERSVEAFATELREKGTLTGRFTVSVGSRAAPGGPHDG